MKLWVDCESVGLMGPTKLIQFALDDGPIQLIRLFRGWEADENVRLALYQLWQTVDSPGTVFIGFNAAFDLNLLYKLFHRLQGLDYDSAERPIKPFACRVLDLQVPAMQFSPLAPFAFNRGGAKSVALLRRIPKVAQEYVANLVSEQLKPLLPQSFELGVSIHKVAKQPQLVTLGFNVKGRLSLKGLMREYGLPTLALADCWPLPDRDAEKPWLPYPDPVVHDPVEAQCDEVMRQPESHAFYRYAKLDILYLKVLYEKLGKPEPDYNSDCVHNMAYLRYCGMPIDQSALQEAERYYGSRVMAIERKLQGFNLRSSVDRLKLLQPHFPFIASTAKKVLKQLAQGEGEGAELCADIVDYGPSRQRLLQIQKVLECRTGRAHPDLRVMGTATDRMAGTSGLNWQGIGAADEVEEDWEDESADDLCENDTEFEEEQEATEARKVKIGLRQAILTPCVGDWASFEVVIAAEAYDDVQLKADLLAGIDLHSIASVTSHPRMLVEGISYEEFRAIYKDPDHPRHGEIDKVRKQMKGVVFGTFYFASSMKVAEVLGVQDFEGQQVLNRFYERYQGIGEYRRQIEARFITADTERWTANSVQRMDSEQTALTGFKRRWNFEKSVACALWSLGHNKRIKSGLQGNITRTQAKGPQSIDMAITSACLGSAIAIQAAVSRQAGNMKIQATGAGLTKQMQAEVWNQLRVPTLQCHDELIVAEHPNFNYEQYAKLLNAFVVEAQKVVPMVKFEYKNTERWSDK